VIERVVDGDTVQISLELDEYAWKMIRSRARPELFSGPQTTQARKFLLKQPNSEEVRHP
jgi:hypothetical protein